MSVGVCGVHTEWLVDTGCNITLISEEIYHLIPKLDRPQLEPHNSTLRMADGSPLAVLGDATLPLTVGDLTIMHKVTVAKYLEGGIIGMNFMNSSDVCIDIKNGKLSLNGQDIPATFKGYEQWC